MPTPAPQPSAPEPPGKPSAARPPSGPDVAAPKPAQEGAIFRALVDAGAEATLAYTAEQRLHTMTSETVAAQLQPLLTEMRQTREIMVRKEDLADFATKADLADLATKADLADFATKADLANTEANLRREIAEREVRLIKWMFGAFMAQAALIVALVVGFMSLLL